MARIHEFIGGFAPNGTKPVLSCHFVKFVAEKERYGFRTFRVGMVHFLNENGIKAPHKANRWVLMMGTSFAQIQI